MKAKSFLVGLTYTLVLGVTTAQITIAQTPDGLTPPNEGICDSLQADGVSKGLYGLCVAFCEAQDWADEGTGTNEAALLTLASSAPSGRILENYNKRKSEGDPSMPCLVEAPCPCWNSDELASIDGVIAGVSHDFVCSGAVSPESARAFEQILDATTEGLHVAIAEISEGLRYCQYVNFQTTPIINRFVDLTEPEREARYLSCRTEIVEKCAIASP